MRQTACCLLVILTVSSCSAVPSSRTILNYVSSSLQYYFAKQIGISRCIFYDLDHRSDRNNTLNAILGSARLSNAVRVVINGQFQGRLATLTNPTLLVIKCETTLEYLSKIINSFRKILDVFDPATKVLVLADRLHNSTTVANVHRTLVQLRYNDIVYLDLQSLVVGVGNNRGKISMIRTLPRPEQLLSKNRQITQPTQISFFSYLPVKYNSPMVRWIQETAHYLRIETNESRHNCERLSAPQKRKCVMEQAKVMAQVDIGIDQVFLPGGRFERFRTTVPEVIHVAIPRARKLYTVELMLLSFTWPAWLILVVVLGSAGISKQLLPEVVKNNLIELTACRLERRKLQLQALHLEKIILLSLIVLISLASSAFQTKIIASMITKPSLQQVFSLRDYAKLPAILKLDLDRILLMSNNSQIRDYLTNDANLAIQALMGFTLYGAQPEVAKSIPYYVLLEQHYTTGVQTYQISRRYPHLELFRHTHAVMIESGIMSAWERQLFASWGLTESRRRYNKRRSPTLISEDDPKCLYLGDLIGAWAVLAIGICVGAVALYGEIAMKKRLDSKRPEILGDTSFDHRNDILDQIYQELMTEDSRSVQLTKS